MRRNHATATQKKVLFPTRIRFGPGNSKADELLPYERHGLNATTATCTKVALAGAAAYLKKAKEVKEPGQIKPAA
ncbi:hypothetical protein [Burkholderia multivorans]|uniref:hypothetical protein n=1 Tax=Burkholderia multivorans TaxID=87883 RepID=UPI0011B24B7A|nr:hypothetical protein [Burkholderia multivorans]MCB4346238.1 hypothetical protein [Burkholderia vietnamiensis]